MGLTLISAVLLVASFPPWGLRWLIFIALIPWLAGLERQRSAARCALQGVCLSMGMSILGFYWVAYVLHQFGEVPWPVAIAGFLIFTTFGQPQFTVFAPLYRIASSRRREARGISRWLWGIGIALLYTGIDWLIPKLFRDTLGHSQYSAPWLRQSAELFGAHGITFLIFWFNDSLLGLYREIRSRREPSIWPALSIGVPSIASVTVALGLALAFGRAREKEIRALIDHPVRTAQGAVIQADIGDFDKIASEKGIRGASEDVMDKYFSLSDQALELSPHPDFLVWPETAYPSTFRTPMTADDLARDERVESFVRSRGFPLLFGGYDRKDGKDFNAFFLLSPPSTLAPVTTTALGSSTTTSSFDEGDLQTYHKNILLLFGEYVPFTEDSRLFQRYFPQVANFGRGPGPEVLRVPLPGRAPLRLSPVICYEVLFPDYVIQAANQGSQLIMNITNDSWFGPYGEPALHLSLSTFRSIETRLPQLRATNTGISTLILPDGSITSPTRLFSEAVLSVKIPIIDSPPTLMKRWGDWFGKFALIVGTLLLGALGWLQAVSPATNVHPLDRS